MHQTPSASVEDSATLARRSSARQRIRIRKRENMTLAEEKALLARFAEAAGAGEMLNIHDLKAPYEKGRWVRNQQPHGLYSSGSAWLAQADAVSVSSQPRPRSSKRLKKRLSTCCEESKAGSRQARSPFTHGVRR